ncbi:CusA/CzcA family heavy metal efflux RND transporter [Neolewinella lacunae]|uniref:CusA/CzcA family heavy metal efflux RND transporter n=1 Tax=Neolewinella lacunae TaxID=1517758 RepID=A0A923PMG2_9BACT|nr:CusA/CzcA family heavy metal efflux RND transporter [Neolewinella lacunae]MBC6996767.1 CusA/CzcA family heavy metal efflux RND transporter [Neolewinella lacunae]MDN3633887.1 CusA/CzcA family heavy metal efflux RND transporter [Neolewinella lacunae]
MFESIIRFSLGNKLIVLLGVAAMAALGIFSATRIPLDAVPDITNNQVQIVSVAPTFAPEEVEQLITYPLEAAMTNIPDVLEVRSISRYGLSVITIVFEETVEVLRARQYVQEQLNVAAGELPEGVDTELMPITTGLGEIYQYVLTVDAAHAHQYDATELRTIQDWIVKRQLNGTPGIIEVSSFGGYLKQYEVAILPDQLRATGISLAEVITALQDNNENSGGSYLERGSYSYYIRTDGRVTTPASIGAIPLGNTTGPPLRVRDVATVTTGSAKRYGAMTMDGKGEVVGGITLMLKGANSSEALANVEERMKTIQSALPAGVSIYPYLDRAALIGRTIDTVRTNLIEGGLIVIFVLLLLLGNLRAGLIVASVIPLSMLFALILMRYFGISANLMSLGAIDFGIVIDGAVIIMEGLLHVLAVSYVGQKLSQPAFDGVVLAATGKIYRAAAFGVLIILVVFLPILALEGVEGKTFRPMAQVVSLAILGSLLLSVTYVPVMASLFIKKEIRPEGGLAHRIMDFFGRLYRPVLRVALHRATFTLVLAGLALALSLLLFSRMGGEFIPTLEEGDIAMQQSIKPGSSLQESIHTSTLAERILLDNFPEVRHVVSKIGTAEVPTDPMAIEDADIMIILKDKEEWTSADNTEDLMALMKEKLAPLTWAAFEFTQPIQLRFNELMTGSKSDVSVKIFGESPTVLKAQAELAADIIRRIDGAGDVKVDQTDGLRQLNVRYDHDRLAQFGIDVRAANQLVRAAYAGEVVGAVYEEERKFDLVVRLDKAYREDLDLAQLTLADHHGRLLPLSEVATVEERLSPMLISREQARRFINIGVNVRNRDVAGLVEDIQARLAEGLDLPPGYEIQYGGTFENLRSARQRLLIAVPIALGLIFLLLYLAFSSARDALMILVAVPLSAIGGILALWLRGMPFSISSGIGFIALFGIAVLNGIVLISAIRQLRQERALGVIETITEAATTRLRPVLMTAAVAAFGFLPMALSTGSGAEVQRPLATVVIGGLLSSTLLTLVVLPALYRVVNGRSFRGAAAGAMVLLLGAMGGNTGLHAQPIEDFPQLLDLAIGQNPELANLRREEAAVGLNRQAIGQWAPLEIDYQGGQINARDFDHLISARQNFNHLFSRAPRAALVDAQVAEVVASGQSLRRNLAYQLATAYDAWRYELAQVALQDTVLQRYAELEGQLLTRQRAGTLGVVEEELFRQRLRSARRNRDLAASRALAAESEVRRLAQLSSTQHLRPRPLALPLPVSTALPADTSAREQQLRARQETLRREGELDRTLSRQPQLSAGYFVQTLEKELAFQGLFVGLALPLDRRESKVRTEQRRLQDEQLSTLRRSLSTQRQQRLEELDRNIRTLRSATEGTDAGATASEDRLLRIASLQFAEGAIDFLTFRQLSDTLLTDRQERLAQLHQLHQLIREQQFLTNTQF